MDLLLTGYDPAYMYGSWRVTTLRPAEAEFLIVRVNSVEGISTDSSYFRKDEVICLKHRHVGMSFLELSKGPLVSVVNKVDQSRVGDLMSLAYEAVLDSEILMPSSGIAKVEYVGNDQ